MANLEQQWADLNLQRSLASTPDINTGELSESDRSALSITDRLLALNENAKLKAEKLRIASEAINQQTNQQVNQQNGELDTSSLDKFTAGLQNKNVYGANYDSATTVQGSLGSIANYGLQTDNITGQRFYIDPITKQRVDYFGKEKGLYIAETDEGQMKIGLRAQGKTFADRYTPDWKQYVPFMKGYGWKPGDEGVDPNKDPYMDIDLPENLAVAYEKYVHSNAGQLSERTAGQGPITEDWTKRLGAGKTEYTTQNAPMWNVDYDTSAVNLQSDTPLPGSTHSEQKFDETGKYIGSSERTTAGAILDTIQAVPAGFAKSIYDVADTTTELVGDLAGRAIGAYDEELGKKIDKTVDLGNEKIKGEFANKITGYDDKYSAKAMDEVSKHIAKATKDVSLMEPSTWDNISGSELASAAATAFSTPETAAYSLGYMVPALFGLGKKAVENVGSNVLKTYSKAAAKIEKSDVAPEIKIAKINELTNKLTLNDKTKMFLAENADAMAYGAMMNNDQMDEYIALNGGEEPTIARSLGGFVANSVGMKLDVGIMNSILKPESGDLASNVAKMFSNVDKGTASKIMANVVEFSTRAASAGIKEMPQEWTQGFIEGFNKVYGTNIVDADGKATGEKVTAEMAAGEKTRLDATTGAFAGLAGGAHTSMATQALGGMPSATSAAMEKINESVDKIKQNRQNKTQPSEPGDGDGNIDDDVDDEIDTIELDDETRAKHETDFNDAVVTLDELDDRPIDPSNMKDVARYISDIGKVDALIKSSILSGAITDGDARRSAIDRQNAHTIKIKEIITGTITSGDEKAMSDLFSDPITSEKMLRSVADELDFDDTKIESNFMKAGYNAGLDESELRDTIEESKIVRRLSRPSDYQTGKTSSQVASEVSIGKSGYLTFRKNALEGIKDVDVNKINRNIEKLEKFANTQSEKLSKLTAGVNSVEDAINNQIEDEIANATKNGKTITREQVLQNYTDGTITGKLDVQTSSKANNGNGYRTTIHYSDVAKRMLDPEYNKGIYFIIDSVEKESKDLNKLNELTQKQASKLPNYNKQFEAENEVDYQNRIKQLDSDVAKGEEYDKFDTFDPSELNNKIGEEVIKHRKNKAELKELKAKLEKLESTKQGKTKVETNTETKPSGPVIKRVMADDIVAPTMPKNPEFVAPQMPKNEQANTPGSNDKEQNPFAKPTENKPTESSPFNKPIETKKVDTNQTTTSGSRGEIKFGSVVKYNNEYYIVRGYSASGALRLTASDGTNISGTPMPDKVTFAKQLTIKSYNNVNYAIDSNNNAYTSNGKVSKEYADKVISLGSTSGTGISKAPSFDKPESMMSAEEIEKQATTGGRKAIVNKSTVSNEEADWMSRIPGPDDVAKINAEFEKAPKIDNEKIANFENLDSVDSAEKSEVVKELENELAIAKAKIKTFRANIEIGKELKQKFYNEGKHDKIGDAQIMIDNYYERIRNVTARIDLINYTLSGSAEIDSILKTSLSGNKFETKEVDIKDGKGAETNKKQKIKAIDIVESSKKTSNRLSGMKIDEITQDAEIKAYADDAVITIQNMLKEVAISTGYSNLGNKVSEKFESNYLRDDLFRGLLFNADGSVNRNIAVAVAMAADEMRALMHSKIFFNSREDVMNMLGYSQEFEVSNAAYNALAFEGKFKKLIADDLATAIFNNIAIKGKEDADIELVAKMRADAGQVALLYMQEKNYIEKLTESTIPVALYKEIAKNDGDEKSMTMQSNEFDSDGKTIPMVRLKKDRITIADRKGDKEALAIKEAKIEAENKTFDEITNRLKKELDRMNDLLAIESTKKNVKFKPSVTTDKKVKNSKISNMNDDSLKTLNVLQSEAFELNEGVDLMFELIDNGVVGEAQLLKKMGYETTKELEGKAYDTVESAIARNGEILDSLNELKALRARVEDPNDEATNELYFDYFFGRNGRYYLDSVGINPQTGKEQYRWLVTPKAHNIDIDFSSQEAKDNQHANFFKLGIAQAFGYGIDKEETANAYAFAEVIMMQDESELIKVFTNKNNKNEITGSDGKTTHTIGIDHVGHTMQAIAALRKYREADNGKKPFTASLSIEFDAVTSGFILKLLQLPILEFNELKKWLKKGGIFLGSEAELADIKSTNDEIALGKLIDSYRTLASKMQDDKPFELDVNTTTKINTTTKKEEIVDIPFKRKLFDAMKPLLGSLKEEFDDGINGIIERVTKEGRELFKYQFMPFNYSAGFKALNKNLGYEMIKNLPDMMIKDGMTKDSKARKLINALHRKELTDKEVSVFIEKLQNESFENIEIKIGEQKIKAGEEMRVLIEDVYGSQVNDILSDEFKELIDANKTVNNAFKAVFMAWKSAYDKEIATLRASGKEVTNSDVDAIVKKLKDKFPMIKAPLSTDKYLDDSSAIAIHNTKLSSNKGNTYGPAKTYVNPKNNNGQATLTVQSMIREFSEAINSGSVIPIHYIDGSFMTKGLAKGGILGVHDAKVVGVGNALSATRDYNENVWKGSKDYSYIAELFDLLDRIRKDGDYSSHRNAVTIGSGENALTFNDVYNEVKELNDRVKNNRKILFGLNSKTMHMTAVEGTDYTNEGEVDAKGWINPIVEETPGSEDKSKKSKSSSSTKSKESANPETNKQSKETNKTKQSAKIQDYNKNEEITKTSNGVVIFGKAEYANSNPGSRIVNSFEDLIDLSNKFDKVMQEAMQDKATIKVLESNKDTNSEYNYYKKLWKMLSESGVEFKPVEIVLKESVSGGGYGVHRSVDSETVNIEISYGMYDNAAFPESPIKVVMHEYIHALTFASLKENEQLRNLVNRLRNHAIKEIKKKGLVEEFMQYGFSDKKNKEGILEPHEFIAELMTSPKFQKLLDSIPSIGEVKNVSLLQQVRKTFDAILKYVSGNSKVRAEASALTDGLQIVYRMFENNTEELLSSDIKEKEKQTNTTGEQALIDDAYSIIKNLVEDIDEFETEIQDKLEVILDNIKGCK